MNDMQWVFIFYWLYYSVIVYSKSNGKIVDFWYNKYVYINIKHKHKRHWSSSSSSSSFTTHTLTHKFLFIIIFTIIFPEIVLRKHRKIVVYGKWGRQSLWIRLVSYYGGRLTGTQYSHRINGAAKNSNKRDRKWP